MKRRDAQPLGLLIRQYLRQEGLESPLNERRLVESWGAVMGPLIASYTKSVSVRDQVLHVTLLSAPLRQELLMTRELIAENLNKHVGAYVIKDIMFH